MTARTPEEVHRLYEEAFNAGDIDSLLSLYESGATFFAQPGGKHRANFGFVIDYQNAPI